MSRTLADHRSVPTAAGALSINLNADLGESFGAWRMGDDAALLPHLDSANLACGFHAGDPGVMTRTVRLARAAGVEVGAHPSLPDLQGFGRRAMAVAPDELRALVIYQIGALQAVAASEGVRVGHVKPHGALSHLSWTDAATARTLAEAVRAVDAQLVLLAPARSALAEAGAAAGLAVALEAFADRAYRPDGTLAPRDEPGAVLTDTAACVAQARAMLAQGGLLTTDGALLPTPIHSLCVHGDTPHAVATAAALRAALAADGWAFGGLHGQVAGGNG